MQDLVVGLLAVAVGALFCFRGFMAMRIVIPIWGAVAQFHQADRMTATMRQTWTGAGGREFRAH